MAVARLDENLQVLFKVYVKTKERKIDITNGKKRLRCSLNKYSDLRIYLKYFILSIVIFIGISFLTRNLQIVLNRN